MQVAPPPTAFGDSPTTLASALGTRTRAFRALGVFAVWVVFALPVLFGHAECTFARFAHYPCPGCGLTRAVHLLESGRIVESLAMHALAVPIMASTIAFAACTVWLTWRQGTPFLLWKSRIARATVWAAAIVHGSAVVLWAARALGFLGGPVPV
jgi:hypothetical protein